MKKPFAIFLMALFSLPLFAQVEKPKTIFLPAKEWCKEHGYGTILEDGSFEADYNTARQDRQMAKLLSICEEWQLLHMMPVTSVPEEAQLTLFANLFIAKEGPRTTSTVILRAVDRQGEVVASVTNEGAPSFSDDIRHGATEALIQLSEPLQAYFDRYFLEQSTAVQ